MREAEQFMRTPTRPVVQPKWIRVADACQMSGIGINKLYSLINTGRLKSILLDGKRLIATESIERLDIVANTPPLPPGSVVMRRGGPGRPKRSAAPVAIL
jgi:hypothetical protein